MTGDDTGLARQDGGAMLGYAYSPRVLVHDPPPPTLEIAGREFTLGRPTSPRPR